VAPVVVCGSGGYRNGGDEKEITNFIVRDVELTDTKNPNRNIE
jgi:hypothetical protein